MNHELKGELEKQRQSEAWSRCFEEAIFCYLRSSGKRFRFWVVAQFENLPSFFEMIISCFTCGFWLSRSSIWAKSLGNRTWPYGRPRSWNVDGNRRFLGTSRPRLISFYRLALYRNKLKAEKLWRNLSFSNVLVDTRGNH